MKTPRLGALVLLLCLVASGPALAQDPPAEEPGDPRLEPARRLMEQERWGEAR